ncbi:VOC family protein [Streptomyces sp. 21So2-11]|uniref:VOC family protein n=1 Tax=Streptomyces sp. 21So2-11 TaxID=3144408 RepID=UPI00321A0E3C
MSADTGRETHQDHAAHQGEAPRQQEGGQKVFGKLAVTLIECRDLEAMTVFYRDRIGLEILNQGDDWISFHTGSGGELIIGGKNGDSGVHLGFVGADLPRAHAALSDLSPTDLREHDTGRNFTIADPEGNSLSFVDHATRPRAEERRP